jgi:hypothetical protein
MVGLDSRKMRESRFCLKTNVVLLLRVPNFHSLIHTRARYTPTSEYTMAGCVTPHGVRAIRESIDGSSPAVSLQVRRSNPSPGPSTISRALLPPRREIQAVVVELGRFAARRVVAPATCNALRSGPSLRLRVVFFPLQVLDLKKMGDTSRFRYEPDLPSTSRYNSKPLGARLLLRQLENSPRRFQTGSTARRPRHAAAWVEHHRATTTCGGGSTRHCVLSPRVRITVRPPEALSGPRSPRLLCVFWGTAA